MTVPARPKIFHITHVDNLPQFLSDGALLPDAVLIARRARPDPPRRFFSPRSRLAYLPVPRRKNTPSSVSTKGHSS
jgi:hypothetical protein